MNKEMFKKDKEELQEYLKFKRRRGSMSKMVEHYFQKLVESFIRK